MLPTFVQQYSPFSSKLVTAHSIALSFASIRSLWVGAYLTRYAPVLRHGIFISPHEEKHFRPALAGGKCFLSPRIHTIFRGGHIFICFFRFCSAIISAAKSAPCGRAFGSHPRGRGFESLQVHQNENRPKGRFSFCRGPAGVEVYPPLRGKSLQVHQK